MIHADSLFLWNYATDHLKFTGVNGNASVHICSSQDDAPHRLQSENPSPLGQQENQTKPTQVNSVASQKLVTERT